VPTVGGTSGELIVTALRVRTNDTITGQPIADVSLAAADAKIDCAAGWSPGEDWITGGGYINGQGGIGRATFGFVAGPGGNPNRGHLTLKDHATGATIHGTVIMSMTECNSGMSHFEGTDTNNHSFQADADDNAPPTPDAFGISGVDQNGINYLNSGPLLAGNIETHGFTCQ